MGDILRLLHINKGAHPDLVWRWPGGRLPPEGYLLIAHEARNAISTCATTIKTESSFGVIESFAATVISRGNYPDILPRSDSTVCSLVSIGSGWLSRDSCSAPK